MFWENWYFSCKNQDGSEFKRPAFHCQSLDV